MAANIDALLEKVHDQLSFRGWAVYEKTGSGTLEEIVPVGPVDRIRVGEDRPKEYVILPAIANPTSVSAMEEALSEQEKNNMFPGVMFNISDYIGLPGFSAGKDGVRFFYGKEHKVSYDTFSKMALVIRPSITWRDDTGAYIAMKLLSYGLSPDEVKPLSLYFSAHTMAQNKSLSAEALLSEFDGMRQKTERTMAPPGNDLATTFVIYRNNYYEITAGVHDHGKKEPMGAELRVAGPDPNDCKSLYLRLRERLESFGHTETVDVISFVPRDMLNKVFLSYIPNLMAATGINYLSNNRGVM